LVRESNRCMFVLVTVSACASYTSSLRQHTLVA
jgi:hypothetical protein